MATQRDDHLQKGANVSPMESMIAGSVSGAIARAITAPLDTVKIRLQLQSHTHDKIVPTINRILRNEGIAGLWKGNVPAEIMYILYGGVQFTSYSTLNKALYEIDSITFSKATHSLIVGTGAGFTSTLLTYPFDLLRTRLAANSDRELLSMVKTISDIAEKDGIKGFFRGIRPALLSVAANTGLMFWAYETSREFSKRYNNIPFVEAICGFIAGASAKTITFPLDTLRKRIQVKKGEHAFQLTKSIIRTEGITGLYKGIGISLLKTAPTSALSMYIFEYTLHRIKSI